MFTSRNLTQLKIVIIVMIHKSKQIRTFLNTLLILSSITGNIQDEVRNQPDKVKKKVKYILCCKQEVMKR